MTNFRIKAQCEKGTVRRIDTGQVYQTMPCRMLVWKFPVYIRTHLSIFCQLEPLNWRTFRITEYASKTLVSSESGAEFPRRKCCYFLHISVYEDPMRASERTHQKNYGIFQNASHWLRLVSFALEYVMACHNTRRSLFTDCKLLNVFYANFNKGWSWQL